MAFNVEAIEKKIDQATAGAVAISSDVGGIQFTSMAEVMEFAKLMSLAGSAVPEHLRGNPGACLAITIQALEWRMSPFAVANKSYIANDRVAYESQLIHGIVEARSPLKARLRHEIIGEGDERRCKVWGTFKGESEPHTYVSETLKTLREARGRNDRGQLKGSPLWISQPETQLYYSATRSWARMFCPDVILGIYAADEMPDEPKDVTPGGGQHGALVQRLQDKRGKHAKKDRRGFDHDKVKNVIEGEVKHGEEKGSASGQHTGIQDGLGSADDTGGGESDQLGAGPDAHRPADQPTGTPAAAATKTQDELDIFPPDRKGSQ